MGSLRLNIPSSSPALTFVRNRQRKSLYAGLASILLLVVWGTLLIISDAPYGGLGHGIGSSDRLGLAAIQNQTLGFEKIFCINLPSRTDKRDAIVLASSITQFRVDWIDGVSSEDMSPKAYPPRFDEPDRPRMLPGEIGSWRAHVNAIQRIISDRISTALILEDDVDWDITLKSQLHEFALGALALQTQSRPTHSPYGQTWDLLWLGHCGTKCQKSTPFYILPNDPTSVPVYALPPYWAGPAIHPLVDNIKHNRIICKSTMGVCSTAYAVTFTAAQKILAAVSVAPSEESMPAGEGIVFDVVLGRLCESGYLRCIAAYPSLMGNWKGEGLPSKGSDIQYRYDGPKEGRVYEGASFQGVVFSVMGNLGRLVAGEGVGRALVRDVMWEEVRVDWKGEMVLRGV
ncbi:hypothetical protein BO94DRAFT_565182 [Aspergillus sclerotioniger CBS 115572]|uniref:Glycosyl transferase family 25 domain-containing protein n=1 Tax=Aspergillus sclerotioniger CBS 115572 TaxID=1450535 RepID=A0A317WZ57_9EURO|nr:hypothetical protein BO94DRAFT_565182 [Aspergillus sclerotioniger CBS 115572]PWY90622.1 hypothetical protein BO94DRAFT_565182 [Aspergillus sclerotioniger CBS 115572]